MYEEKVENETKHWVILHKINVLHFHDSFLKTFIHLLYGAQYNIIYNWFY